MVVLRSHSHPTTPWNRSWNSIIEMFSQPMILLPIRRFFVDFLAGVYDDLYLAPIFHPFLERFLLQIGPNSMRGGNIKIWFVSDCLSHSLMSWSDRSPISSSSFPSDSYGIIITVHWTLALNWWWLTGSQGKQIRVWMILHLLLTIRESIHRDVYSGAEQNNTSQVIFITVDWFDLIANQEAHVEWVCG